MTYFEILSTFLIKTAPAWIPTILIMIGWGAYERKAFNDDDDR